jgi:hypothetical protein
VIKLLPPNYAAVFPLVATRVTRFLSGNLALL